MALLATRSDRQHKRAILVKILRWIAEECLDLEPPPGWAEYKHDKTDHWYYHNSRTGEVRK
eukprot:743977-Pyramimonas_sp.AAC.1